MNITQWVQLIAPFIAVAFGLVTGGKLMKKHLPSWLSAVQKDAPTIIKDVENIGGDIGKVFGWPGLAAVKAPFEVELHSLTTKLHATAILSEAKSALAAFGNFDTLSKNGLATSVQMVISEMSKLGVTVSEAQAQSALKDAQAINDTWSASQAAQDSKKLDATIQALGTAGSTEATPATASTSATPAPTA